MLELDVRDDDAIFMMTLVYPHNCLGRVCAERGTPADDLIRLME